MQSCIVRVDMTGQWNGATMSDNPSVEGIFTELKTALSPLFDAMEWGEDEIERAQRKQRSKVKKDLVWSTFKLLRPTDELMSTEFVYRAHCQELIRRALAGEDTRPGTDVELVCVCCHSSLLAPLTTAGTGLYMRMWTKAFHDKLFEGAEVNQSHYEAITSDTIDKHEAELRRKLTQDWRVL